MFDVVFLLALRLGLMSSSSATQLPDSPVGEAATAVLRREAKALQPLGRIQARERAS